MPKSTVFLRVIPIRTILQYSLTSKPHLNFARPNKSVVSAPEVVKCCIDGGSMHGVATNVSKGFLCSLHCVEVSVFVAAQPARVSLAPRTLVYL